MAFWVVLPVLGALLLGAISPGASFVYVVRTSLSSGRRAGLLAAVGMGIGACVFALGALLGLAALLQAWPGLATAVAVVGGLYLAWIGARLWRAAKATSAPDAASKADASSSPNSPTSASSDQPADHPLWTALGTQMSNPKTALVFAAVFAALLPAEASWASRAAIPPLVFVQETAWYAVVATVFSLPGPRRAYVARRHWVDRLAGGILLGLGALFVAKGAFDVA